MIRSDPAHPCLTPTSARRPLRAALLGTALLALAACEGGLDWDMRAPQSGASTTEAARQATAARPRPDERGVISYPGYQVAVARRGDTVTSVAGRVGISAGELARYNALDPNDVLRDGEVLALPRRVAEPAFAAVPGAGAVSGGIDVSSIATGALDRAESQRGTPTAAAQPQTGSTLPAARAPGPEPVRHRVVRGETAFSIARLYNVTTRALADWNGLGPDMVVREGQYLMIPVPADRQPRTASAAAAPPPGTGSATPTPPSAAQPLPAERPEPAATPAPASPNLGAQATATSSARFAMPVDGRIIREYAKGRNDGVSFGAPAGTAVRAAADGTVATITRDTEQMPIVVVRHEGNLLTIYVGVDDIRVERGARVSRGERIGSIISGDPSFLHFEVREGFESVDPMRYLQ
jgi:murein DD-endopeptidase MepM/ murein hydrolase activator NlpD